MEMTHEESGGAGVLRLAGEIDLHASPALRSELQARAAKKEPCLLIDFRNVAYIDSSGLATLIEYVRETGEFGGKLALFGLQKKVRTIFELVRLNELFVIEESEESALAKLAEK